MTTTTATPIDEALDALAGRHADALGARRRDALEAFQATPLPHRALHLWRYTDPASLLPDGLQPVVEDIPGDGIPAAAGRVPALLPADSDPDGVAGLPGGVTVRDLETAIAAGDLDAHFASLSTGTTGKFEALNLALFSGGACVEVAAGARPDRPVGLVHRVGAAGTLACPRSVIIVREGAEAELVEEFETPADQAGGDALVHAVTEIFLEPGARLVHTVVNHLGDRVRANLVQRARVDRGAVLTGVMASLGGRLVKTESSAQLAGERARNEVLGAVLGGDRQRFDAHYLQDHVAPRTSSDLLVRVALRDRARASYTGNLRIAQDAPGCEARQENRNLLLSEKARADSIPELEILTHEVQCSHAAATGPVDPEAVFYLRSRGLNETEAVRAIVLGFLEPVFARVPGQALADALRTVADARLGGDA